MSNAVTTPPAAQPSPVNTLRALLDRAKPQIALALPRHLTPERMIRIAITAVQRTPDLLQCEQLSILGCVIQASQLGLEMDGVLGHAYMVPFRNKRTGKKEAQFIVGYKGLIELARRTGEVSYIAAHEVRENDAFDYQYGTDAKLTHRPAQKNRGAVVLYYAVLKLKDGSHDFEVMSIDDVLEHKQKHAKGADRADSPWNTAFDEMGKKTVLRRLAKRAPVSVEMRQAASLDEQAERGELQYLARDLVPLTRSDALAVELAQPGLAEGEVPPEPDAAAERQPGEDPE